MQTLLPSNYSEAPTPLPPSPRAVCARKGQRKLLGLWFFRLFIFPHTCFGIYLLVHFCVIALWAVFGTNIPAQLTAKRFTPNSKSGAYTVRCTYLLNGTPTIIENDVSGTLYDSLTVSKGVELPGSTMEVRYLAMGPIRHVEINTESPWSKLWPLLLAALFWNGAMSFALYGVWYLPLRQRWLTRYGIPIGGTITKLYEQKGKTNSYHVGYTYIHPDTGESIRRKMECRSVDVWKAAVVGQPVTVLYGRNNPLRSVVYEFGLYQARDGGAGPAAMIDEKRA